MSNEVLTVENIMEILHIGRNAVYKLLKDGTIKSIKVGKKYIVPQQSIKDFLTVR